MSWVRCVLRQGFAEGSRAGSGSGSCCSGCTGSAGRQRKNMRWGTGGKMLIAISPDTTAFWDKSNWWTWRRMPGREWKSDMTPEKGRRCRLQQAIIYWLFNSHAGPLNAKCCQKVCTLFFPSIFKKIFLNNLGSLILHLMMREISSLHAIASLTEVSKLSESIHEE